MIAPRSQPMYHLRLTWQTWGINSYLCQNRKPLYSSSLLPQFEMCNQYKLVDKSKIEVLATFLVTFANHMNIFFIIKVKILMLTILSCRSLNYIDYCTYNDYHILSVHFQSLSNTCLFGTRSWTTPNHIPLKYMCLDKKSKRLRVVSLGICYLSSSTM